VIRFETALDEHVAIGDREFDNERIVRFRWTVLDVDRDGLATIAISFERVRLNLEMPPVRYDSDDDPPDREPTGDSLPTVELLVARAQLNSVMLIQAIDRGGNSPIFGSEAVFSASQFTPGDFPVLPEQPVGVGDSWRVPVSVREATQQASGFSEHALKAEQSAGGRSVLVLECRTEMFQHGGQAAQRLIQQEPTMTVNRFDPTAGRFLSRIIRGGLTLKNEDGQTTKRTYEARQQLLPTLPEHRTSPLRPPAAVVQPTANSVFEIVPHAHWDDANGNKIIDGREEMQKELQDVKNIFSTDENVCLAMFILGLKDADFRFDLFDMSYALLTTSKIPLAGDGVFAYREIAAAQLPGPGVYFFHWYLNGKFVHHTPVQVTPPMRLAGFKLNSSPPGDRSPAARRGPVER
jgi:hypothetical protein